VVPTQYGLTFLNKEQQRSIIIFTFSHSHLRPASYNQRQQDNLFLTFFYTLSLQVTHISSTMTQDTTDNDAGRKRPALHHQHHDNHHDSGSPNHNHAAETAVAIAAGHEDHDGIDFQTDHHRHHNVNDQ